MRMTPPILFAEASFVDCLQCCTRVLINMGSVNNKALRAFQDRESPWRLVCQQLVNLLYTICLRKPMA